MNKQVLLILGVIAVLAGAYFILVKPQTQPVSETVTSPVTPDTTTTEEKTSTDASAPKAGVVEFKIEGGNLKFTPNEIKAKVGDKVKITFKNTAGTHSFFIDEFDVKTQVLGTGKEETVELVADKAGEYEFYCSVPGHRAAGMKGVLYVL